MVDRSTVDFYRSLFPPEFADDLLRDIPRKLSDKGRGLVGVRRNAASAKPLAERAELLAVSKPGVKGAVKVEAKLTRADGVRLICQATVAPSGAVTAFEAEEL